MRKNLRRGMTLVEVVIASAILTIVILITMQIVFNASNTYEKGSNSLDLEERGREFMDTCEEEFLAGQFNGVPITVGGTAIGMGIQNNNTQIAFRHPSSTQVGGIFIYGYRSPLSPPNDGLQDNLACIIRFEAEEAFRESNGALTPTQAANLGAPFPNLPALDIQVVDMDINKDGDENDTFVRGNVVKYVVAPDGHALYGQANNANILSEEPLCQKVMLRVMPGTNSRYNGNVDGDATNPDSELDPLFQFVDATGNTVPGAVTGGGVVTRCWTGNWDSLRKGFLLRLNTSNVNFRNTQ